MTTSTTKRAPTTMASRPVTKKASPSKVDTVAAKAVERVSEAGTAQRAEKAASKATAAARRKPQSGAEARARKAAKATKPAKAAAPAGKHPLYLKAREIAKKGNRGPGKQMTDAQLFAYIAKARHSRPEATCSQQLEIAYWVDGIATSRPRWNAAWESMTDAGQLSVPA